MLYFRMFDLTQFNISTFFFKGFRFFNSEFPLIPDQESIVETSFPVDDVSTKAKSKLKSAEISQI